MKPRFVFSQNGMSLVSVMVAAAIGCIVAVGMASMIVDMFRAQKSVALAGEWSQFVGTIDAIIKNPTTCQNLLEDKPFNTNLASSAGTPLVLENVRINGPAPVNLAAPFQIAPGLQLTRFVLHAADTSVFGLMTDTGTGIVPHEIRRAAISLESGRDSAIAVGGSLRPAMITIPVVVLNGRIKDCRNEDQEPTLKEACEQMGGTYLPNEPPNKRCKPRFMCKIGGTYTLGEKPTTPGQKPNQFTNQFTCPGVANGFEAQYTAYAMGDVVTNPNCGKGGCNPEKATVFQCLLCQ